MGAAHGIGHDRDDRGGDLTPACPTACRAEALTAGEAKAAKGKAA
jgi:hypothetical protein